MSLEIRDGFVNSSVFALESHMIFTNKSRRIVSVVSLAMKTVLSKYLRPYYGRMLLGFVIKFIGTIMDLCLPPMISRSLIAFLVCALPSRSLYEKSTSSFLIFEGGAAILYDACAQDRVRQSVCDQRGISSVH